MTRKDTILIAVVINAGLLAILFMTAVIYDTDTGSELAQFPATLVDDKLSSREPRTELIAAASTGDEVDNVLQYYNPPVTSSSVNQNRAEPGFSNPMQFSELKKENSSASPPLSNDFIEVKVKRGDVLEKIAKANRTSVSAIKRANQLENERLTIGQTLKIPLKSRDSLITSPSPLVGETEVGKETPSSFPPSENEPVYYVVKSGDNPWKIAKQFGVKYDEILRLNNLDEEKARNLKIGDRVRVK